MRAVAFAVALAAFAPLPGCRQEPAAKPLRELKPAPLPALPPSGPSSAEDGREAAYEVAAAPVHGDRLPKKAARVELEGELVRVDGQSFDPQAEGAAERLRALVGEGRAALLVPDPQTYLMQASPLLAALDDAGVKTHLLHPDGEVSYWITLSDERDFRTWVERSTAGQVRIIQRADGFELQTNLGKLPGADPNGPSVPLRGGKWDLARLRAGVTLLKARFDADAESCIVPSFGIPLSQVGRALSAYYPQPGRRHFTVVCLVYPRPGAREGGQLTGVTAPGAPGPPR